jgi:phosphoglycerol geranylgeranyltransferase
MFKVEKYLLEKIGKEKLLFVLIDPIDYKSLEEAIEKGKICAKAGADAILIGGSVGVQGEVLDYVTKNIKEETEKNGIPIILFPGNIATLTKYADAVYFMTLINSRNTYWMSLAQILAAPVVKRMGIEAIPIGYIVVEPGGSVGWVGDVNLIPREKTKIAVAAALAAQYMGNHFVLMDVGSGSKNPVPNEMVKEVSKAIDVPLIVAGGMKNENDILSIAKCGADILQIGTLIQETKKDKIATLISSIKEKLRGINEYN